MGVFIDDAIAVANVDIGTGLSQAAANANAAFVKANNAGGIANVKMITSGTTYFPSNSDFVMIVATGGSVAINMPASSPPVGKLYTVKLGAAGNSATVFPTALNATIDGNTSITLTGAYNILRMLWTGSNYTLL